MVFSLSSGCFPIAEDPHNHSIAFRERDQQQPPQHGLTDDNFVKLVLGMPVIIENDSQWIGKHRDRFVEGDTTFGHVREGFLRIPLEFQWHACSSDQSRIAQLTYLPGEGPR
jgi:hypothetical protein